MKNLVKYQIGLAVLGLFATSLTIVLFVQAGAVKEDTQTYKTAEKVADKIDDYIYDKNEIPKTLKDADISEENPNISYKKLSNEKYVLCVTYRAKGNSIDGTALLTSAVFGDFSDHYDEDYESSRIYLDTYYDRGENCQTANPYIDRSTGISGESYGQYYTELDQCETLDYGTPQYYECVDKASAKFYGAQ